MPDYGGFCLFLTGVSDDGNDLNTFNTGKSGRGAVW